MPNKAIASLGIPLYRSAMKCTRYGPDAWLVQFADSLGRETFERGRAICRELEQHPPTGLREFVPGFTSVLLEFQDSQTCPDPRGIEEISARWRAELPPPEFSLKQIPVQYSGEDLGRVASFHGLSADQVIALHSETIYHVYLLGFAPGFPYLGDLPTQLHTPRLPAPRPRVKPGSVAIGGQHTGIYSVASPGGWNIIGYTTIRLFDVNRSTASAPERAFYLQAGDRVQFVPE
jgi:inhibitor of KinA